MKRIRTSFALALAASSLCVASSASANTPINIGTVPIIDYTPVDVLGTGQGFDQTWTVINWDAKRDSKLGDAIQSVHGAFDSINQTLGDFHVSFANPNLDANAVLNASARAYAQPAANQYLTATLGLHAETSATFYAKAAGLNPSLQPGVLFDASFVRPGKALCLPGNPKCFTKAPYYHVSFMVRSPTDQNYVSAVDYSQPNPLADWRRQLVYYSPNLNIDLGFVQLPVEFDPGLLVTANYSLDPFGGNIDVEAEALAVFDAKGTPNFTFTREVPLVGAVSATGTADAEAKLTLLSGSSPILHGADAHAKAWINATTSVFGGALCGGASGTVDASEIGAYKVTSSTSGEVKASCNQQGHCDVDFNVGPFASPSQIGSGVSYSWKPQPLQHCVTF